MEVSRADSTQTKVSSGSLDELCQEDSNDSAERYFFDHFFDDWETNQSQSSVVSSSNLGIFNNAEEKFGQEHELNDENKSWNGASIPTDETCATDTDDKDMDIGATDSATDIEKEQLMHFGNSTINTINSLKESVSESVMQISLKVSIPLNVYQNQLSPADCRENGVKNYVSGHTKCSAENTSCPTNVNAQVFSKTNVTSADSNDNVIHTCVVKYDENANANRNGSREFVAMKGAEEEPLKEISNICSPNASLKTGSEGKELLNSAEREENVRIASSLMLGDNRKGLLNNYNTEGKVMIASSSMMDDSRSKFEGSILNGLNDCVSNEFQTTSSVKGANKKERDNKSSITLWKNKWIRKQRRQLRSDSSSWDRLSSKSVSEQDYRSRIRERRLTRSSQLKPRSGKHNRRSGWSRSSQHDSRSRSRSSQRDSRSRSRSRSRSTVRLSRGNKKYLKNWRRSVSRSESRSRSWSKSMGSRIWRKSKKRKARSRSRSTVRLRNRNNNYSKKWSKSLSTSVSRSRSRSKSTDSRSAVRQRNGNKKCPMNWSRSLSKSESRSRSWSKSAARKDRPLARDKRGQTRNRSKGKSLIRDSSVSRRHSKSGSETRESSSDRCRHCLKSYSSRRSTSSSVRQRARTRERHENSSRQWYRRMEPSSTEARTESSPHVVIAETNSCSNLSAASPYWQPSAYPMLYPVIPTIQNTAQMQYQMAYPVIPTIQNTAPKPYQMTDVRTQDTLMYVPSTRDPRLATSVLPSMQLPLNLVASNSMANCNSQSQTNCSLPAPVPHPYSQVLAECFKVIIKHLPLGKKANTPAPDVFQSKLFNVNRKPVNTLKIQKLNMQERQKGLRKQKLDRKLENNESPLKKVNPLSKTGASKQKCNTSTQNPSLKVKEASQFKQEVAQKLKNNSVNYNAEYKTLAYEKKSNMNTQKPGSNLQLGIFNSEEGQVKINDITIIQSSVTECNNQSELEEANHPWCGPACESLFMCSHVYNAIQSKFWKGILIVVPSVIARKPSVVDRFHPSFHFSTVHLRTNMNTSVQSDVDAMFPFKSTRPVPPTAGIAISFNPTKTTTYFDASLKHLCNSAKLIEPLSAETKCLPSLNNFISPPSLLRQSLMTTGATPPTTNTIISFHHIKTTSLDVLSSNQYNSANSTTTTAENKTSIPDSDTSSPSVTCHSLKTSRASPSTAITRIVFQRTKAISPDMSSSLQYNSARPTPSGMENKVLSIPNSVTPPASVTIHSFMSVISSPPVTSNITIFHPTKAHQPSEYSRHLYNSNTSDAHGVEKQSPHNKSITTPVTSSRNLCNSTTPFSSAAKFLITPIPSVAESEPLVNPNSITTPDDSSNSNSENYFYSTSDLQSAADAALPFDLTVTSSLVTDKNMPLYHTSPMPSTDSTSIPYRAIVPPLSAAVTSNSHTSSRAVLADETQCQPFNTRATHLAAKTGFAFLQITDSLPRGDDSSLPFNSCKLPPQTANNSHPDMFTVPLSAATSQSYNPKRVMQCSAESSLAVSLPDLSNNDDKEDNSSLNSISDFSHEIHSSAQYIKRMCHVQTSPFMEVPMPTQICFGDPSHEKACIPTNYTEHFTQQNFGILSGTLEKNCLEKACKPYGIERPRNNFVRKQCVCFDQLLHHSHPRRSNHHNDKNFGDVSIQQTLRSDNVDQQFICSRGDVDYRIANMFNICRQNSSLGCSKNYNSNPELKLLPTQSVNLIDSLQSLAKDSGLPTSHNLDPAPQNALIQELILNSQPKQILCPVGCQTEELPNSTSTKCSVQVQTDNMQTKCSVHIQTDDQ